MACACDRCARNARTLDLAQSALRRPVLRKAFRAAAKRWHPDRFENEPEKRLQAEEQFKLVQVAYRELWEHCDEEETETESAAAAWATPTPPAAKAEEAPPLFFGGAPGCYVAPHLPRQADRIVSEILEGTECVAALLDLSAGMGRSGNLSDILVLTNYRLIVRNPQNIIALLWYTDLGAVQLVDHWKDGKPSLWQQLAEQVAGREQRFELRIHGRDGKPFRSLGGETDDSAKKVVYNFLLQKRRQTGVRTW